MMAPTKWEHGQINYIDKLLQRCKLRKIAFERQQNRIHQNQSEELVSERLRYFATDLYSVLDYMCYLLFCHFNNNGNRSDSPHARRVNFPSPMPGRSRSEIEASVDGRLKVFTNNMDVANPMYVQLRELILNCLTTEGGANGGGGQPPSIEVRSLKALHYLRNCTVHRNLVTASARDGVLYYNQNNGSHEILPGRINERENDPNGEWVGIEIHPAYWVEIPTEDNTFKPITVVAPDLFNLVKNIRDNILRCVFPPVFPGFDQSEWSVDFGLEDGLRIGPPPRSRYGPNQFDANVTNPSRLWAV